ncbi:MAG: hypothetical protein GEU88_05290 [Solirubrobacterales bacterium]|nr:hypothetical protein [Solirubrobacterales bacterium]
MSFRELAARADYPPARELVVREVCRALYGVNTVLGLRHGALVALSIARSLATQIESRASARRAALDAVCIADELLAMARIARAGIGRG